MKLFIDDIRESPSGWFVARTSSAAIEFMKRNGCPREISFDHDLGGDDTAMRVVRWMIEHDLDNPGFIPSSFSFNVHSANPVGRANIEAALNRYLDFKESE